MAPTVPQVPTGASAPNDSGDRVPSNAPMGSTPQPGAASAAESGTFHEGSKRAGGPAVPQGTSRVPVWRRPTRHYAVIAVAVAAVLVVAGLVIADTLRRPGVSSTTLLVPKRTTDLIPALEFDAVIIDAKSPSVVTGNITIIYAIDLYVMNYTQYQVLARKLTVVGYGWTSGLMQNVTYYDIDLPVPSGFSYFVLFNPEPVQTLVGYNSALILQPA